MAATLLAEPGERFDIVPAREYILAMSHSPLPSDSERPEPGFASESGTLTRNVYHLERVNSIQLRKLAEANAVVILPISPLEEHGPHLPLGTDAIFAQHFAGMAAEIVTKSEPDTPVVLAPLVPVGTHVYRFMGSVFIRQRVIRNLVIDYGCSLARAKFKRLLIVSSHGGPGHMVALDEAATSLTKYHKIDTINLTSTIIYKFLTGELAERISAACARPLTDEEKSVLAMDYHAGWWETSMMLLLHPELVDQSYRELPDALVPRWKLRPRTPLKPPAGQGYLGAPARADADFAKASLVVLREEASWVIAEFLMGRIKPSRFRSKLYNVPLFRTNRLYWLLAAILVLLFIVRMVSP
jgi:creatinine amidohydrolase